MRIDQRERKDMVTNIWLVAMSDFVVVAALMFCIQQEHNRLQ